MDRARTDRGRADKAGKKPSGRNRGNRDWAPGSEPAAQRSEAEPLSVLAGSLRGKIRPEAGPALSAAARLRSLGVTTIDSATVPEKEKISITLDKPLVDEIRAHSGGRALSASINELLYAALAQERLGQLVDDMEDEAGAASPEAYERVLAQWFAED